MVRLEKNTNGIISVANMNDGDVGVIVEWYFAEYHGTLVQRYGQHLIAIGKRSGHSWPDYFVNIVNKDNKIRLLSNGEKLIIE